MRKRIYVDTSVVGGYFDDEFKETTGRLFSRLAEGKIIFVLSDLLEVELVEAPQKVRDLLQSFPPACPQTNSTDGRGHRTRRSLHRRTGCWQDQSR